MTEDLIYNEKFNVNGTKKDEPIMDYSVWTFINYGLVKKDRLKEYIKYLNSELKEVK